MPLRIYENNSVLISEDISTTPKQILFSNSAESTDITSLTEVRNISESFPIGTTAVSMGNMALGNYLWCKPTADCQLDIDGAVLDIKGGKETKIWGDFTAVSVIVVTAANKVQIILAGD